MDAQTGALWTLALGVIGLAFVLFFRTPKEVATEAQKRIDDLEDAHHALDLKFAAAEGRLSAEIRHLANTIEQLSQTIKSMDERRISGRHPRA